MSRMANIQANLKARAEQGVFDLAGVGAPVSGLLGTGRNVAGKGSTYTNISNGVVYVNEYTKAAPYWTPLNLDNPALLAWHSDFRSGQGKALADTAALATLNSGLKVFGQGIAENDSGLVVAIGENGAIASLTTTDEAAHLAAIGVGLTTSVPYQPDSHERLVIEALVAMSSAITLRSLFLGFLGTVADALDPPVTGSTVTATLVQDDLAGVIFDTGLTDADRLYAVHNKSDEAASQNVTTGGRDTGADFPAAGTYTRLRVEINSGGDMLIFKDFEQIASIEDALDADEEVAPVLLVRSTSAAVKTMLVKFFRTWGTRN
jgi:hypothetical protein